MAPSVLTVSVTARPDTRPAREIQNVFVKGVSPASRGASKKFKYIIGLGIISDPQLGGGAKSAYNLNMAGGGGGQNILWPQLFHWGPCPPPPLSTPLRISNYRVIQPKPLKRGRAKVPSQRFRQLRKSRNKFEDMVTSDVTLSAVTKRQSPAYSSTTV